MAKKADLKRTRKLIKGMEIPSRPTVMLEVIRAQNAFAPDLRQVAQVISRDVVLAARVLQEANTTLPGLKRQVASIDQAVVLLGLARVRKIVTEQFLSAALVGKDEPLQRLRHRYADVARAAAWVATALPPLSPAFESGYLPPILPDEAYILGLFHDSGLALLMQKFADYESFYWEVQEGGYNNLVDAEYDQYRTNHCLVGYLLCEQWQLPGCLCQVILEHHKPNGFAKAGKKVAQRKSATLLAVLKVAERINGEISDSEWREIKGDLFRFLDMREDPFDGLVARGREELEITVGRDG